MPVNRSALEQTPPRLPQARRNLPDQIRQGNHAAENMKGVHDGEYIEKGTVRGSREVKTLRSKLSPHEVLSGYKN
jgi:hypothetical protein